MDHSQRRDRVALALALALVLAGLGIVLGSGPRASAQVSAGSGNQVKLKDSSPEWAKSSNEIQSAPKTKQLDVRVYLKPRNKSRLDALVKAVSDPSSKQYRKFITPDQYKAEFGPAGSDVASIKKYLEGTGFKVTGVGVGRRYVAAHGSVVQAQQAFGTKLKLYKHSGQQALAPAEDISLPDQVSGKVLGVVGLQSPPHLVKPATAGKENVSSNSTSGNTGSAPPPSGFRNARPCSLFYGQLQARFQADYKTRLPEFQGSYRPYAVCGYVPSQLRGAYGVSRSSFTGKGSTVAITDAYAAPTIRKDANHYAKRHGDTPFKGNQFSQVKLGKFRNQKQCGPSGWYGEETLDVEAVHGMATGSNVIYYGARSCYDNDFLDTLARVVDDNKASIVTNSWGSPSYGETSGLIRAYEAVFEQGAVQGIGFFFSSGDSGDDVASTGLLQTDYPTSDPFVTSVGGTSLAVGPSNNYKFEAGWGTDKYSLSPSGNAWQPLGFIYGAGGGFSSLFNRPDYQRGVVPAAFPAGRAVPDISLDADPTTGMLVGETQTFPNGVRYDEYRIGGTSLASPLMAGMQALTTEAQGNRLGFANPRIYDLARTRSRALRDVTSKHDPDANVRPDYANGVDASDGILYSVRTFDDDSSLNTRRGWDDVTGVGSPNGSYFRAR